MPKENNQFGIDYAFPGLCTLCQFEIAEFNGSNSDGTPIIKRFKGNRRVANVILDDGSNMAVTLCKGCFKDFTGIKMKELMENEINGWQAQVDRLEHWNDARKINYMKKYSKRFVVDRGDKKIKDKDLIRKPDKRKLKVRVK